MNAILVMLLAGCPASKPSTDTTDTTDTGGQPQTDVMPQEGSWQLDDMTVTENTCGFDTTTDTADTAGPDTFEITVTGDTTFDWGDSGGGDDAMVIHCSVSGSSFTCDELVEEQDVGGDRMEAVLTIKVDLSGTMSSSTRMSASLSQQMSCDGADCSTIEGYMGITLPCTFAADVTASAI